MKKIIIGFAIVFVLGFVFVLGNVGYIVSLNNEFVDYETRIVAISDDVPNIITKTTNTIVSKSNVLGAYRKDFKEIVAANMQGRYGKDGSKATWQWIQENNINMDTSMFKDIMNDISAGNNEMQNRQTEILEIKRIYDKRLREAVPSLYNKILGFPKIDMKKYGVIILNDTAKTANETKTLNAITPF